MADFRVCVVAGCGLRGRGGLAETVSECLAGGAGAVQLREKNLPCRVLFELAADIKKVFRGYDDRLFIVNDRADIALAAGADGVHLGQEDLPPGQARKILGPQAVIGVSVSKPEEAVRAASEGASYLGAGAVFSTLTKPGAKVIGLSGLRAITGSVGIPVVAIGGIKKENIREVIRAGASGAAVVSEVMESENPRSAVRELLEAADSA